jgi:gamma-glutamyltranspeptidase/glutathione hydrolase
MTTRPSDPGRGGAAGPVGAFGGSRHLGNFSHAQTFAKAAARSARGIVSAQHRVAAEVGAAVLAEGGDCMDAVVATSFAIGAVEPWMSGVGGIGTLVHYRADEDRYEVIDFGGSAPAGLDVGDYPLGPPSVSTDLFPWRRVVHDRNLVGATSVAVPGVVAGMGEAHRRYGRIDWAELVRPAVALAREGPVVDWFSAVAIAGAAADLRRFASSAEDFLVDGLPPSPAWSARAPMRMARERYAATLEHIASDGARSFYDGDLARHVAAEIRSAGGSLSVQDLNDYAARVVAPLAIPYRDALVHATPELTGGPTLARVLKELAAWKPSSNGVAANGARPDAAAYKAYARALQTGYRQRLDDMGDVDGRRATGAEWLPVDCTTHFNVVDAKGNMAAVTQTLLGVFGSKFVTPETGILMNNGLMWFDPEPGRPNSLAPGKRCLSNYTPAIARLGNGRRLALGASGGRRILSSVAQLLSFCIDYGLDLQAAFDTPRIDASEGDFIIVDVRLDPAIRGTLAATFDCEPATTQTLPMKFACPSAVMHADDGKPAANQGATEVFHPWADAVIG